jgi:hypothetical protein
MNTDKGSFVLEVIMMVANCVLSPNSARKIVPKVVRKIFQSIAFPPHIVFCLIENVSLMTPAVGFNTKGYITNHPSIKSKARRLSTDLQGPH